MKIEKYIVVFSLHGQSLKELTCIFYFSLFIFHLTKQTFYSLMNNPD